MIVEFAEYLRDLGRTENTISGYCSDIKIFFKEMNIEAKDYITAADVQKWVQQLLEKNAAKPATIARRINALSNYYAWLYEKGHFTYNPMENFPYFRIADEENETIEWLTEDEVEELLERIRKAPATRGTNPEGKYRRDRIIVYIFVYLGLRVSELTNLKVTDLDLVYKKVRIVGKGNVVRTIPINNILYQELLDWLAYREKISLVRKDVAESNYLLYSQRSNKLSERAIQRILASYSTKERHLHPHMLRHTFCVWVLIANNNDFEKVKRLAGHKHIKTTIGYTKSSFMQLADSVEKMPKI